MIPEILDMAFGNNAFVDWVGEIAFMRYMTKLLQIQTEAEEEEERRRQSEMMAEPSGSNNNNNNNIDSQNNNAPADRPESAKAAENGHRRSRISSLNLRTSGRPVPGQLLLTAGTAEEHEQAEASAAAQGHVEKLKEKEKKKVAKSKLSREHQEKLEALDAERKQQRDERVATLTNKLVDRVSVWTETSKDAHFTHAFKEQMRLEVENMKLESFGIDILHAIGDVYVAKSTTFFKSQKFFGIGGWLPTLKNKGTQAKEAWGTMSSLINVSICMTEAERTREAEGDNLTPEKEAEMEQTITSKCFIAMWRVFKSEFQGVLRDVCDRILLAKTVPLEKRKERAQAILMIGEIFCDAERTPEEEKEASVWEQLVADELTKRRPKKKSSRRSSLRRQGSKSSMAS